MHTPHDPDRRSLCATLLATGLLSLLPERTRSAPADGCRPLRALLEDEHQPGMAGVVVERGRIVAMAGTGLRDDASAEPVRTNTVFELGSITKVFTALLVFRLRQRGLLAPDMPVGAFLDDLPAAWRPITLRRLLSHTSGIPNYLDEHNFLQLMPTDPRPRELLAQVADRPLDFAPGTRHAYSNTNYILLGLLVEQLAGMDYWRLLRQQILDPLEMRGAGPRRKADDRPLAQGHLYQDGRWLRPPVTAPGAAWAAGSLLASIEDMARFAIGLDQERLLPASALREMWRDTPLEGGGSAGWGAGWELADRGRVVGHGGGTAGFTAYLRHVPALRRTVVVLINRAGDIAPKEIAGRLDQRTRACDRSGKRGGSVDGGASTG